MNNTDNILKELAQKYISVDGEKLYKENQMLKENNVSYITPRMDAKIKEKVFNVKKQKNYKKYISLIAAALAIMVILPFTVNYLNYTSPNVSQSENPAEETPPLISYLPIPLAAKLPSNFIVSSVEQDKGQTIYHLKDDYDDNVIITLSKKEDADISTTLFTPIKLNGQTLYGLSTNDYNVLTFEKDNIVYFLSCKYDINSLINISKTILL